MTFEREYGIVAHHPAAIVDDADQLTTATFDFKTYACGARVERIFKKLFDDGRRPLHHFAGGDLVGDLI